MPKKTKKEKLLAQRHRTHLTSSVIVPTQVVHDTPATSFQFVLPVNHISPATQQTVSIEEFAAIKKDLIKTVVITIGIIAVEILLTKYLPH